MRGYRRCVRTLSHDAELIITYFMLNSKTLRTRNLEEVFAASALFSQQKSLGVGFVFCYIVHSGC